MTNERSGCTNGESAFVEAKPMPGHWEPGLEDRFLGTEQQPIPSHRRIRETQRLKFGTLRAGRGDSNHSRWESLVGLDVYANSTPRRLMGHCSGPEPRRVSQASNNPRRPHRAAVSPDGYRLRRQTHTHQRSARASTRGEELRAPTRERPRQRVNLHRPHVTHLDATSLLRLLDVDVSRQQICEPATPLHPFIVAPRHERTGPSSQSRIAIELKRTKAVRSAKNRLTSHPGKLRLDLSPSRSRDPRTSKAQAEKNHCPSGLGSSRPPCSRRAAGARA